MSLNPSMNLEAARSQMLAQQIRTSEVTDSRVLDVLATTPREAYVPQGFAELAFADMEIPIGHDQRMLTPQIEGRILQALQIQSVDEVFEIGTGTGFLTACLERLGSHVLSIDIFAEFVSAAQRRFQEQRLSGIQVDVADATVFEWPRQFDVVLISAAIPQLSTRYTDLLKPGGRLFVFTGAEPVIRAQLVTRLTNESLETENLFETSIEPMINARSEAAFEL
jgi:protein-L-isoaspartate(D-aspartate) O-methyltransferase